LFAAQDQYADLARALLELAISPIEDEYLLVYPDVVAVEFDGDEVVATIRLKETWK
jgi:hypothetical protein